MNIQTRTNVEKTTTIDNVYVQRWDGFITLSKLLFQFPSLIRQSTVKFSVWQKICIYCKLPFSVFFGSFKYFFKVKERFVGTYKSGFRGLKIDVKRSFTLFFIGIPIWYMIRNATESDLIRRKILK